MDCKKEVCRGDNRKGGCHCYAFGDGDNAMRKQVCAREVDGVYYRCEAGCCKEGMGCPGQCKGVGNAPAYRVITSSDGSLYSGNTISSETVVNALVLTMIAISVMRLVVATGTLFQGLKR